MSGGGGGNDDKKQEEAAVQAMQYAAIPGFMGSSQGLLADQLARGGYGSAQDIGGLLAQIHQPMNMGYVTDPNSNNRMYSGAAYMASLRDALDKQGIKKPEGKK